MAYAELAEKWAPLLRYRTKPFADAEGERLYNRMMALYQFLKEIRP